MLWRVLGVALLVLRPSELLRSLGLAELLRSLRAAELLRSLGLAELLRSLRTAEWGCVGLSGARSLPFSGCKEDYEAQ